MITLDNEPFNSKANLGSKSCHAINFVRPTSSLSFLTPSLAKSKMKRLTTFGKHSTEIGTYIYRLIDPRSGHTFYVGKGRGDRVFDHANNQLKEHEKSPDDREEEEYLAEKNKRISEIIGDQLEVHYVIHRHSIETVAKEIIKEVQRGGKESSSLLSSVSDKIAYEVESALIDAYEGLTNKVKGHGNSERGCQHAEALQSKYKKDPLVAEDHLIAFSIGNSYKSNKNDLDKAVRYAWRANLEKAKQQNYVLAHNSGLVIGVFEVCEGDWLEINPADFPEISKEDFEAQDSALKGRIGIRAGGLKEAPEAIAKKYMHHVLPPSRTTNPVRYFAPDEQVIP